MTDTPVQYDPSKSYTWTEETRFSLTGPEFGMIFNNLVKEELELLKKLEMINILKSKLKENVENGSAFEKV